MIDRKTLVSETLSCCPCFQRHSPPDPDIVGTVIAADLRLLLFLGERLFLEHLQRLPLRNHQFDRRSWCVVSVSWLETISWMFLGS